MSFDDIPMPMEEEFSIEYKKLESEKEKLEVRFKELQNLHVKRLEELGEQITKNSEFKKEIEKLKEALLTLKKDVPWGQGDVVTMTQFIDITLNIETN